MTLRDELAAVLGPGNDDATAYAQAGYVLEVIGKWLDHKWTGDMHPVRVLDALMEEVDK